MIRGTLNVFDTIVFSEGGKLLRSDLRPIISDDLLVVPVSGKLLS